MPKKDTCSISLYFAGPIWKKRFADDIDLGEVIQNKLSAYSYPTQLDEWFACSAGKCGKIIVDSGAFSAWSKGIELDINAYIQYCLKMIYTGKKEQKEVRVVNIDVIPGKKGQSALLNRVRSCENTNVIETAAREGFRNLRRMVKAGIKPIHVFHQGESWKWLHKMVEYTDYIGISPANDMSVLSRKEWMLSVFEYMDKHNIDVKTHGFAVWMPSILKTLPFTSCDAATWRIAAAWGNIYYPVGGFSNPDYSVDPLILQVSKQKNIKGLGILTKEKLKMFESDGYSFEYLQDFKNRALVNVRYFLGLENWLKKYWSKKLFCARFKLI